MLDILGIDLANPVAVAFFGTITLMFFVSPLVGWVIINKGAKFSSIIAAVAVGIMVCVGAFIGLSVLLGNTLTEPEANNPTISLISFAIAVPVAILAGIYVGWVLATPQSALKNERRNLSQNTNADLSFMEKRQARLKKKKRR